MPKLTDYLNDAEKGVLTACTGCPRNPKHTSNTCFSQSCPDHFANENPVVVAILRDPGGYAPYTKVNCFYCNEDRTAKNVSEWFKHLSIEPKEWYATNAVMHGSDLTMNKDTLNHCKDVLREQIRLLSPKLVIGFGKEATWSLYNIQRFEGYCDKFKEIEYAGPVEWFDGTYVAIMPNPSGMGTANAGGKANVVSLWKKLGAWLEKNR